MMTDYRRISARIHSLRMGRLTVILLALAATVSAAVTLGASSRDADYEGGLVFVSLPIVRGDVDYERQPQLYSIRTDGTGLVRLAKNAADPAISPDGARIAFTRGGIWLMDSNGANQRRLLRASSWTHSPAWSADGTALFFLRADGIYRIRADGSGLRRVSKATCLDDLAVSPNGRDLAYVEWPSFSSPNECDDQPPTIYASDLSGRKARALSGRWAESPAWSPDGKLLAFSSEDAVNGPPWGIYVVGAGGERRLTSRTGTPSWSPDGSRIAIAGGDLWIIRSDGGGLRSIRKTPKLAETDAVWLVP